MNIETKATKKEVTDTVTLTMTEDEALRLYAIFGAVGGVSPTRELARDIWGNLRMMLDKHTTEHHNAYDKYIEKSMCVTRE